MRISLSVLGAPWVLAVLVACGAGTPNPNAENAPKQAEIDATSELERYLPLEDGTVFSYDTRSENSGARGVLIVQVSRPREGRADLRMGARTERLELEPGGIAYVEGGYLLKAPLKSGQSWRSRTGTTHIKTMDEHVSVPAGQFDGCLRTVEETQSGAGKRSVDSVYCPHVGLVLVDVAGSTPEGEERETATLRSFGPKVELTGDSSTTSVTTSTDEK